jgi:hypothetical protein
VLEDKINLVSHEVMNAKEEDETIRVKYADGQVLAISLDPFKATLFVNDKAVVTANGENQFYFEYHRSRQGAPALAAPVENREDKHKGKKIVGYWEDGEWWKTMSICQSLSLKPTPPHTQPSRLGNLRRWVSRRKRGGRACSY